MTRYRDFATDRAGATTIIFAVSFAAAMMFVALGVDYARFSARARQLQQYADAAAIAGAKAYGTEFNSVEDIRDRARDFILGSDRSISKSAIRTTTDQTARTVTVDIREWQKWMFAPPGIVRNTEIVVRAKAEATGGADAGEPEPVDCVVSLAETASSALLVSGGGAVVADGCKTHINSSAPDAVKLSGGSTLTSLGNCIVGGVSQGLPEIIPPPDATCPQKPDPFKDRTVPAFGSCDHTNLTLGGGNRVLTPGVYCGGLRLSSVKTATLTPGLYVIKDGAFTISGGGLIEGDGVTLVLTGTKAGLVWSGGGSYRLKAASTGDLAGFLIFLDWSVNVATKSVISGGGQMFFEGVMYFPGQKVEVSGTGMTVALAAPWTKMLFSGGSELAIKADPNATDTAIPPELLKPAASGRVRLIN